MIGATGLTGRSVVAVLRERGIETLAHVRPDSPDLERWRSQFGALGADMSYWPFTGLTFAARAGVRFGTESFDLFPAVVVEESTFTAGGGVTWQRVTLDYAWEPFQNAGDAHRIGLRIR